MSKKKESLRFWAQKAKMSLTANSWFESARRKFFMNSTYIISRKLESNVFGLRRPRLSVTPNSSLESERRKFFMNSKNVHHV